MSRKAFTEHPEFFRLSRMANDAVVEVAEKNGCLNQLGSSLLEARTGRVVDDLTRLLLAAHDINHGSPETKGAA